MCARCDNGWSEYNVNGEHITSDFCGCPEGDALKNEMNQVWGELDETPN